MSGRQVVPGSAEMQEEGTQYEQRPWATRSAASSRPPLPAAAAVNNRARRLDHPARHVTFSADMSHAAGIALIVLGAILTFAVKGGHIGNLDLHAMGVILMLAGVVGILLPTLIRNRSRLSRPTIRSRQDVMDDGTRTVVNYTDGSQTLVEHEDGAQTFAEHFDAGPHAQ